MLIELKVAGAPAHAVEREVDVDGTATLRALLTALVELEVSAYERRRDERRLLHVLTEKQIAAGTAAGRIVSGGSATTGSPPPVADAVQRATEAFDDGVFFVFVDGAQIEDLDEPITVGPGSRLRLVRLVALAGG